MDVKLNKQRDVVKIVSLGKAGCGCQRTKLSQPICILICRVSQLSARCWINNFNAFTLFQLSLFTCLITWDCFSCPCSAVHSTALAWGWNSSVSLEIINIYCSEVDLLCKGTPLGWTLLKFNANINHPTSKQTKPPNKQIFPRESIRSEKRSLQWFLQMCTCWSWTSQHVVSSFIYSCK